MVVETSVDTSDMPALCEHRKIADLYFTDESAFRKALDAVMATSRTKGPRDAVAWFLKKALEKEGLKPEAATNQASLAVGGTSRSTSYAGEIVREGNTEVLRDWLSGIHATKASADSIRGRKSSNAKRKLRRKSPAALNDGCLKLLAEVGRTINELEVLASGTDFRFPALLVKNSVLGLSRLWRDVVKTLPKEPTDG